jgi:hypothetical protein
MPQKFTAPLQWNLPLSGAVTMPITMPNLTGAQFGLFNIDLGGSENPALERQLIDSVGSYGRQLGRICDALSILTAKLDPKTLSPAEGKALKAFQEMADLIHTTKNYHTPRAIKNPG